MLCVLSWAPLALAARVRPVPDELLVRAHGALRRMAHTQLGDAAVVGQRDIAALDVKVVRTAPGTGAAVARRLRASGLFRYVEPNYYVHVDAAPNDPLFPEQWGLAAANVPAAWDTARGAGVVIAIVDSGIDPGHPDLAANVIPGFNVLSGSDDTSDDNGHGTHMAGIAAASGFNGIGVIGIAPDAELMPIKVLDASGAGTYADLAEGIVYAADHGARVINLSIGGEVDSSTLSTAVAYAQSKGVVMAAAAGNDGTWAPSYPAAYPGVVAVGAIDPQGALASFSNFGPWLTLVAPGVNILTTDMGGGYADSTGTSPATPFVAGAAALLLAANPSLDPKLVASLLAMTTDDLGSPGFDPSFGWGRLDIAAALAQAANLAQWSSTLPPSIAVTTPPDAATVQGIVGLSITPANDSPIARVEYFLDGTIVAAATAPPFDTSWDATGTAPGPHLLGATAYDVSGNRGMAVPVTLIVGGPQPNCESTNAVCLPGGGAARTDCFAEWLVAGPAGAPSVSGTTATCTDGAPCDQDGQADGACTFNVGLCFAVGMPATGTPIAPQICQPEELNQFRMPAVAQPGQDLTGTADASALVNAVAALSSTAGSGTCVAGLFGAACAQNTDCDSMPNIGDGVCALQQASLTNVAGEQCTATQTVRVPLRQTHRGWRSSSRRFRSSTTGLSAGSPRKRTDTDSLRLVCLPPR